MVSVSAISDILMSYRKSAANAADFLAIGPLGISFFLRNSWARGAPSATLALRFPTHAKQLACFVLHSLHSFGPLGIEPSLRAPSPRPSFSFGAPGFEPGIARSQSGYVAVTLRPGKLGRGKKHAYYRYTTARCENSCFSKIRIDFATNKFEFLEKCNLFREKSQFYFRSNTAFSKKLIPLTPPDSKITEITSICHC